MFVSGKKFEEEILKLSESMEVLMARSSDLKVRVGRVESEINQIKFQLASLQSPNNRHGQIYEIKRNVPVNKRPDVKYKKHWIDEYCSEVQRNNKKTDWIRASILKFECYIDNNDIESPSKTDFENFYSWMLMDITYQTAKSYLMKIKKYFRWLELKGYYPDIAIELSCKGRLMNVDECADVIGITSQGVLARIRRGALRGQKAGGKWYVYETDLYRGMKV